MFDWEISIFGKLQASTCERNRLERFTLMKKDTLISKTVEIEIK